MGVQVLVRDGESIWKHSDPFPFKPELNRIECTRGLSVKAITPTTVTI